MEQVPVYLHIIFIAVALLAFWLLYRAGCRSRMFIIAVMLWLALQAVAGMSGFYTVTDTRPPRFALLLLPELLLIAVLFLTVKGRRYIDQLDAGILTLLHIVRIPVELVLLGLSIHKAVPQLMTFEGSNPDILSGITAPFVFYFGYMKKRLGRWVLLLWNIACLALLINIVIRAMLAAPSPMQQLAFDQPNIAIVHFPYVWLPCFVVPAVLFAHLVAIRRLLVK